VRGNQVNPQLAGQSCHHAITLVLQGVDGAEGGEDRHIDARRHEHADKGQNPGKVAQYASEGVIVPVAEKMNDSAITSQLMRPAIRSNSALRPSPRRAIWDNT
jgi:hypothetical protein